MKTEKFILILFLYSFWSCSTYNLTIEDLTGSYLLEENKGVHLDFYNSSFVLHDVNYQKYSAPSICCDTLALGSWKIENDNLLSLSSPEELGTFTLNMDVTEKLMSQDEDMLSFVVNSPIEDFYRETNAKNRPIKYQLELSSDEGTYDIEIAYKRFDSNEIKLSKKRNWKLQKIQLTIYIAGSIYVDNLETRVIYTLPYEVKDTNANVFEIDLPNLNFQYLTYYRLQEDYVKVINKNKLRWNGNQYIKK